MFACIAFGLEADACAVNLWTFSHVSCLLVFVAAILAKWKKNQMAKKAAQDPVPGFPSAEGAHWFCGHTMMIRNSNCNGDGFLSGTKKVYVDAADPQTGVASLWFFNVPSVSVLQGKDVKKILLASSYRESHRLVNTHMFNILGKRNLISLVGKEWKLFRSAVHKSFTKTTVQQFQRVMHEAGNLITESLCREISQVKSSDKSRLKNNGTENNVLSDHGSNGKSIIRQLLPLMKMVTIDVFGLTILDGFDFQCSKQLKLMPLAASFEYLTAEFARRFHRPWDPTTFLYNIPTASNLEFKRHRNHIRTFVCQQVANARAIVKAEQQCVKECTSASMDHNSEINNYNAKINSNEGETDSFIPKHKSTLLTNLVRTADAEAKRISNGDHSRMVEETLNDVVLTLLFGAYETSSLTLTYALYLLAVNPHVQANCVEEVNMVLRITKKPSTNSPLKTSKQDTDDNN